jgi:phage-related protein
MVENAPLKPVTWLGPARKVLQGFPEPVRKTIGFALYHAQQGAKLLGIKQPNVSALMKGHLDGFSAERLFRFLNKLDKSVEIVIKDKPRRAKRCASLAKLAM